MFSRLQKFASKLFIAAGLAVVAVSNALAVDPTSLQEVATGTTAEIVSNKGMVFTIMGAVMGVTVLLMIFYKGKKVTK